MADEKWSTWTTITEMNAADLVPFLQDSSSDNRTVTYADFFKNESGNWIFEQQGNGDNIIFNLDDAGGTPRNLLTLDPDKKAAEFMAITLDIDTINADTDALDVGGFGIISVGTGSGNVIIGALVNGQMGQIVHIFKSGSANDMIIEHNEGTGNQNIILAGGADLTFSTYGGVTLVFNGTNWYQVGGAGGV